MNKKIGVYVGIGLFIGAGIHATTVPNEKPEWKNLKILPKNITEEQMDGIMYQYTKQLGVTCSYCHPDTKPDVFPRRVDFETDDLPEKQIARKMMIMTANLNKKYFNFKNDYSFEKFPKAVISCKTCHRGLPKPSNMILYYND